MNEFQKASAAMIELLKKAGSDNLQTAFAARQELAKALTLPLRQGVLNGDITTEIYEKDMVEPGMSTEYPLDFLSPGTEGNFSAYTIPAMGRIPERHVEGDYIMVYTNEVAASIDCALKYIREGRWGIVRRMMQVLEGSFIRKINTDGWHVILAAAYGRNLQVYDDTLGLAAGVFTKRLVELMKNIMRRNANGNSTSVNRGKMTHLYISPEGMGDIRAWNVNDVDDVTRREIFLAEDNGLARIFGVNLRDIDELGVDQEFQDYFTDRLGGTFSDSNVELVVGLDLQNKDSFVMSIKKEVEIIEDPTYQRSRRYSLYGYGEWGFGCLDSRKALLGSF